MAPVVSITAPGFMGAGIGRVLSDHGVEVRTLLEGRSEASQARAAAAGMKGVGIEAFCEADMILSILPPANAVEIAERLAPVLARATAPTVYADLNAICPATAAQVGKAVSRAGRAIRYVDGGIIGQPPECGREGPVIYLSGDDAPAMMPLAKCGLDLRRIEGGIGAASALKMCYGGMTKGFVALATALLLAAERNGVLAPLLRELHDSQPGFAGQIENVLPRMYAKAYRWAPEMEEISAFLGSDAAGPAYESFAELYRQIAEDFASDREKIGTLARGLAEAAPRS